MKLVLLPAFFLLATALHAQNISGKWYGKLTQGPGGYRSMYDFELYVNQDDGISGYSYASVPFLVDAKLGLHGLIKGDTITLQESKYEIQEENIPADWIICIKTLYLAYTKIENKEFLKGRWSGVDKEYGLPCIAGQILLARNKEDLQPFLAKKNKKTRASLADMTVSNTTATVNSSSLPFNFNENFKDHPVQKITEIEVENSNLYLLLNDYSEVDDDSVSVFLNRDGLVENVKVEKSPLTVNFTLDSKTPVNELILYAPNQGKTPPNTVLMTLIDGNRNYQFIIDSERYKSAGIYLKLRKPPASVQNNKKAP